MLIDHHETSWEILQDLVTDIKLAFAFIINIIWSNTFHVCKEAKFEKEWFSHGKKWHLQNQPLWKKTGKWSDVFFFENAEQKGWYSWYPLHDSRVLLKCGCSFSIILMWATIQRTKWCCLVFYSNTVVYISTLLLAPGSVQLELIQPKPHLLCQVSSEWEPFPEHSPSSLHGGRRKDITRVLLGEAELQYLCQGPMVQYQRIK